MIAPVTLPAAGAPRPAPCETASPATETVEHRIAGHRIRFRVRHAEETPAAQELARAWQRRFPTAFFHFQQLGQRPTFLGIAAVDVELGRAFAVELVCGGWGWRELRRKNLLFRVDAGIVRVGTGPEARPTPGLERLVNELVLPAARARVSREAAGGQGSAAGDMADAKATVERDGCRLAVVGRLLPAEAGQLAETLAAEGLWDPAVCGHGRVEIFAEGCEAWFERDDPAMRRACERFTEGFCRHVAISDLHLGLRDHDTFGTHKLPELVALLEEVIWQRSTLVLNGDFLELMHARYGEIRRSYPEVFRLLPHVRRIVYVAGNHDEEVLGDTIKQTRRAVRVRAMRHAYAEVGLGPAGLPRLKYLGELAFLRRHAAGWERLFADPRVREVLREILAERQGRLWLSHGFAEEGVAFKRQGPRDTPEERPDWYVDESVLGTYDAPATLLKLMSDRRQRLDRVIRRDWGGNVTFVRYWWDAARGLYFEHGHFAMPECNGSSLGRWVSTAAGVLKRCGVKRIEHWVEERLGGVVRAVHPAGQIREVRRFTERQLAVARLLRRVGGAPASQALTLCCGHTHQAAAPGEGPVGDFVARATGVTYLNLGAWSNRHREGSCGEDRSEWARFELADRPSLRTARHAVPVVPGRWRRLAGWIARWFPAPA